MSASECSPPPGLSAGPGNGGDSAGHRLGVAMPRLRSGPALDAPTHRRETETDRRTIELTCPAHLGPTPVGETLALGRLPTYFRRIGFVHRFSSVVPSFR